MASLFIGVFFGLDAIACLSSSSGAQEIGNLIEKYAPLKRRRQRRDKCVYGAISLVAFLLHFYDDIARKRMPVS